MVPLPPPVRLCGAQRAGAGGTRASAWPARLGCPVVPRPRPGRRGSEALAGLRQHRRRCSAGAGQLARLCRRRTDRHGRRMARCPGPLLDRPRPGCEGHGGVDGSDDRRPGGPGGPPHGVGGGQGHRTPSGRHPVGRVRHRDDPGRLRVRRPDRDDSGRRTGDGARDGRSVALLRDRAHGSWSCRLRGGRPGSGGQPAREGVVQRGGPSDDPDADSLSAFRWPRQSAATRTSAASWPRMRCRSSMPRG